MTYFDASKQASSVGDRSEPSLVVGSGPLMLHNTLLDVTGTCPEKTRQFSGPASKISRVVIGLDTA